MQFKQRQLQRQRKRLKNESAFCQTLGTLKMANKIEFMVVELILTVEQLFHIVIRSSKQESFHIFPLNSC